VARLQDENKGVRQAVAAALAKLGGPDAARKIADRLKVGAETEPAVRNALWAAAKTLVDHSGSADLAQELGDRFFAREGAEEMQHAAAMYESALAKLQPAARSGPAGQALYEKLVDAYIASGTPDAAAPALRQLLAITPPANATRVRELNQQLGRILLAKEPGGEAMTYLAAAFKGAAAEDRVAIVKAVQARAETLIKAEKADQAAELLDSFGRAVPDTGGTDLADSLNQSRKDAADAAIAQAIAKLSGTDEQAAAATAALKKIGQPALPKLFDALEAAAKGGKAPVEAKVLATIETVTGDKDSGYNPQAPLQERLKIIAAWRQAP
jgi:tetratricopeptide (TPR) repeat protein